MCGIAGFLSEPGAADVLAATASRMAKALSHRGPDAAGTWTDSAAGLALGHRRLSIIDLSAGASQPMVSPCGRFALVYNGELYNYTDLRKDLDREGERFTSDSDTEVLLRALSRWGLEKALERSVGMFAFALWDREERTLSLARDRFGEKPLYYAFVDRETFVFGSELKALTLHPRLSPNIDVGALALYMRYQYIPSPYSIFAGVRKLEPSHWLRVSRDGAGTLHEAMGRYWSLPRIAADGASGRADEVTPEMRRQIEHSLRRAVRSQMVADVPLGAFLSGGIDSSLVVALMQDESSRPVKTFTIGFSDPKYDESAAARAVAAHLGTDHTELVLQPKDVLPLIPKLSTIYDEPFADSSQIPTYLVAELARRHVTVALSGDGGDELFGGYSRYQSARRTSRILRIPRPLRAVAARALKRATSAHLPFVDGRRAQKAEAISRLLPATDAQTLYRGLLSVWKDPGDIVQSAAEPPDAFIDRGIWSTVPTMVDSMMLLDSVTYLPDDILTKVDRAAMAVSLEGRVPLLDHRIAELAWTLPLRAKLDGATGKRILRDVLAKFVPRPLFERPKAGFGIPIGSWLRGALRPWAEELLRPTKVRQHGLLNASRVQATWQQHLSGERDWTFRLWTILMLQAWLHDRA